MELLILGEDKFISSGSKGVIAGVPGQDDISRLPWQCAGSRHGKVCHAVFHGLALRLDIWCGAVYDWCVNIDLWDDDFWFSTDFGVNAWVDDDILRFNVAGAGIGCDGAQNDSVVLQDDKCQHDHGSSKGWDEMSRISHFFGGVIDGAADLGAQIADGLLLR